MHTPIRPVRSPPRLKSMRLGNAFAKSFAGDTTFAAMLTASVATTTVNIATATIAFDENVPPSAIGSQIGAPKIFEVAEVIVIPIAANTVIVVGSAMVWPIACSRCDRPNRVKSGMLSDSVDQNAIVPVSAGMNTDRNGLSPEYDERSRIGPSPPARSTAHHTSTPVIT